MYRVMCCSNVVGRGMCSAVEEESAEQDGKPRNQAIKDEQGETTDLGWGLWRCREDRSM